VAAWRLIFVSSTKQKAMTPLKSTFLTLLGLIGLLTAQAQDKRSFTYGEFKAGYGITQFGEGLDQSYESGNFSTSGGGVATLAVYRKFSWGNYFNSGLKFKSLGAGPAQGDNGDEMFFNFWGAAITTKIFPFNKAAQTGPFVMLDYYFVSQFTQKYKNESQQQYNHQFAIGNAFVFGIGYDFMLKNGNGIILSTEYEMASRQGEVTGVGEQDFKNSNIAFQIGLRF
jgi:hypothetical protein